MDLKPNINISSRSFVVLFLDLVLLSVIHFTESASPEFDFERVLTAALPEKCHPMIHNQFNGSKDVCADIIGPTPKNSTKKAEEPRCPTLKVWVPKKTGFTEFVEVTEQCEVKGGFSIAVYCHALHQLPFQVTPIFVPFVNSNMESNGTYDDILRHIQGKTCEGVAGDVTIRGTRAQYVEFTIPYMSSEVYVLVRATPVWNQTLWTLLRPFTRRLWLSILGACIFIGVAIAILEYREGNPEFKVPSYQKLVLVVWFPISTFFFNQERIRNKCSKVVLVMWLAMIFIVLQIFTACLSSWLTIDQLRAKLPASYEKVGFQVGSFVKNYIMDQYHLSPGEEFPLSTIDEYEKALSNGTVTAIFDELPFIDLFLAKYNSGYMKFGPQNEEPGIAFAFPLESPLTPEFSRAVINVTESQAMMDMKKKYLGFQTKDQSQSTVQAFPQSLDIHSLIGLFVVMGTVTIGAIIWYEVSRFFRRVKILPRHSMHR